MPPPFASVSGTTVISRRLGILSARGLTDPFAIRSVLVLAEGGRPQRQGYGARADGGAGVGCGARVCHDQAMSSSGHRLCFVCSTCPRLGSDRRWAVLRHAQGRIARRDAQCSTGVDARRLPRRADGARAVAAHGRIEFVDEDSAGRRVVEPGSGDRRRVVAADDAPEVPRVGRGRDQVVPFSTPWLTVAAGQWA